MERSIRSIARTIVATTVVCTVLATLVSAVSPISEEQAVAVARSWLDALVAQNVGKLAEKTRFPFSYKSTSAKKTCEGTAADAKKLATTVDCLARRDHLLLEELGHAESLEVKVMEPAHVPLWLRKMMGRPAAGERLVGTFINGDGITFEFVLVVVPSETGVGAVQAFLVSAEVERG